MIHLRTNLPASVTTTIDDDFRGKPLAQERWKTLGDVLPTEHGLRLGGVAGARQRPYLLTAQEFDPSYGAITVVMRSCDSRIFTMRKMLPSRFLLAVRTNAANPALPGRICLPAQ